MVGSYPKPRYLWKSSGRALLDEVGSGFRHLESRIGAEAFKRRVERATRRAVRDQDRIGIDFISDGEEGRAHYVLHLLQGLAGIDLETRQEVPIRNGLYRRKLPTVVDRIEYRGPITVAEFRFARDLAKGTVKVNLPGPATVADTLADNYYRNNRENLARDYAAAISAEVEHLVEAGCRAIQFDDPLLLRGLEQAGDWGIEVLDSCIHKYAGKSMFFVHICRGYPDRESEARGIEYKARQENYAQLLEWLSSTSFDVISIEAAQDNLDLSLLPAVGGKRIMLGILDVGTDRLEQPGELLGRAREALEFLSPEQLILAPDCGLIQLKRRSAVQKLRNLAKTAGLLNNELDR